MNIYLIIIGMMVVTLPPRILPVWLIAKRQLPNTLMIWLKFIPVAILSALLAPELLLRSGNIDLSSSNLPLWVALPTFLLAWKTRNLFITVIFGIAAIALTRYFF